MASTSGTSRPSATVSKMESLTCAVCLDIFTEPKILPCFHTFCKKCLEILPNEGPNLQKKISCPACRTQILVPDGGTAAFQADFHIDLEDLEKARAGSYCTVHPNKELELYCSRCQMSVCTKCILIEHNGHTMRDMTEVAANCQLEKDRDRLKRSAAEIDRNMKEIRKDQNAVLDKVRAIEIIIKNRHLSIYKAADVIRDEALASLETVAGSIGESQNNHLHGQQENLQELTKLQQRVQQALDSGAGSELVTVAREMRCGRDNEEAVQKLTTKQMTTVYRPVLRFSSTPDAMFECMRDYLGSAAKMEMAVSDTEVTVVEQFRCCDDSDTDVYHVCPLTDDTVWLSYEPCALVQSVCSKKLGVDGTCVKTQNFDVSARVSMVRRKHGKSIALKPMTGSVYTYAKKCDQDMTRFYRLDTSFPGQADVKTSKIVSEDPLHTETTNVFTLQCTAYRAFDVDASEQLFVVLEEGKTPDFQRRVQLYRRKQTYPIATYIPPVAPCQPSDVCFYTLGDQEVLLVADELNDAIHVVNVQDGRLSFARYLSPGCQLLVQPTALNTDMRGRLWVACRGGVILTCTTKRKR